MANYEVIAKNHLLGSRSLDYQRTSLVLENHDKTGNVINRLKKDIFHNDSINYRNVGELVLHLGLLRKNELREGKLYAIFPFYSTAFIEYAGYHHYSGLPELIIFNQGLEHLVPYLEKNENISSVSEEELIEIGKEVR